MKYSHSKNSSFFYKKLHLFTLYNDDTQNNRHNPKNLLSHENEQIEWNENISDKNIN